MRGRCACGVRMDLVRAVDHWECRGEPPPQPKPVVRLTFEQRYSRWERMTPEQRQTALRQGWLSQIQALSESAGYGGGE